jgi:hypothetical protein
VAGNAAFVIGTAVTAVTAGRIKLAFDLVQRREIAAMRHISIRTISVFQGRLKLCLIGMAVIAE